MGSSGGISSLFVQTGCRSQDLPKSLLVTVQDILVGHGAQSESTTTPNHVYQGHHAHLIGSCIIRSDTAWDFQSFCDQGGRIHVTLVLLDTLCTVSMV